MLIAYSMPAVSTITIVGGTWLTADGGAALCDGRPARKARFQWSAGLTLDSYVQIELTFVAATRMRVLGILGSNFPPGVRVDFLGAEGGGLGGSCDNAKFVRMSDGTVGAWGIARPKDEPETGVIVRIFNDADGMPWASVGTVVDIGEVLSMPAVEFDHGFDWEEGYEDSADIQRNRSGQLNAVRRACYRTYSFSLVAASASQARGGESKGGMHWSRLRSLVSGGGRCVVVPRWQSGNGYDLSGINATALYGTGEIHSIRHLGGDWYTAACRFEEIPAV